jgi:3-deoxy-D-manno-octulosonic-acid transferase
MYLVYSFLLTLGLLVLLPRFLFQAIAHGKYISGFAERLGSVKVPDNFEAPVIWIHCVSVGETQAARPLVDQLRQQFPSERIVISTVTLTGQRLAREVFKDHAQIVFYFPFDWRWTVRRSLDRIRPSLVLIMETELWPNFFRECQRRDVPLALVNGRISRQSQRQYALVRPLIKRVLSALSLAAMQSEADAQRITDLGMGPARVQVTGSMKFDAGKLLAREDVTRELDSRFKFRSAAPVILAASTHGPEEKILIESLGRLSEYGRVRLLLAPRHPERFNEVATLIHSSGLSWARRTNAATESDAMADIVLLDTIGELPGAYPLADIVFVGGSIAQHGGHNPLEPAAVGACVVTGAHTSNFQAIVDLLLEGEGLVQLPTLDEVNAPIQLGRVFSELLADPVNRQQLGQRAKTIFETNQGATNRTLALLKPFLNAPRQPATELLRADASA